VTTACGGNKRCSLAKAAILAAAMALPRSTCAEPASTIELRTAKQVIGKLAPQSRDPAGWARDILANFKELKLDPTPDNFCSVIAIVRQESSFAANPEIPGLGAKAEAAAVAEFAKSTELRAYFALFPNDKAELLKRIRAAKTERDLDLAHRWFTAELMDKWGIPLVITVVKGTSIPEFFEAHNRIRTIGSMQVSVNFARQEWSKSKHHELALDEIYKIRDALYTRKGGLLYGMKQLLGYQPGYPSVTFRFADYNAGRFSSRNAAVQEAVSELTGSKLELDGDLLAYSGQTPLKSPSATETQINALMSKNANPLTSSQIRSDLSLEKSRSFRETATFQFIRKLYEREKHRKPSEAILPQIELHGPKITRRITTAGFARSVEGHYWLCMRAFQGIRVVAQRGLR
jgi:hypothetical protein